jgi:hypothetical protein
MAVVAILKHNRFSRATMIADIKGIADATQDTMDALPGLFKEPRVVEEDTLRRLYGPKVTPTRATTTVEITSDMVRKCLESVAPLTTPHKECWRAEHEMN